VTERLPFRPLCKRTVASKGFCTSAELQPTSTDARCKGEVTGPPPCDASGSGGEKVARSGKSADGSPGRTSVRY
jgi:hypothetical protein